MYTIQELSSKKVSELREIASESNVPKNEKLKKQDLIYAILDVQVKMKMKPARGPETVCLQRSKPASQSSNQIK